MRRAALAVALLALAVLPAPAAAETHTETADSGTVHAAFSYDVTDDVYSHLHLTVTDGGATIVDEAIPDDQYLQPGGYGSRPSLRAADLDGDGTVEVVLDLYTGGAHCCLLSWIYSGTAPKVVHDFRDPGYRPVDVDGDGRPEFLSADPGFEYVFTSYAGSPFPLQVWRWKDGRLHDVTRSAAVRPRLRREARSYLRTAASASTRQARQAALAGYAADECSLRSCDTGLARLKKAQKRKQLSAAQVRAVRKALRRLGYLR